MSLKLFSRTAPAMAFATLPIVLCAPAEAAGTLAGTAIKNSATATYDLPGGGTGTVTSNEVSIRVDEVLDVAVASTDPADVQVSPGAVQQLLTFRVTNSGNGSEAFRLTARDNVAGDDFDPSVTSIVLDTGNGVYDPGVDIVYSQGANDPVLAADQSITVFVISSIPAASNNQRGRVELVAVATTGQGAPGTTFAGQGQGGGDAVVGASSARSEDDGHFIVSSAAVTFVKSASVTDPNGGATQVPGSVITYTLVATVSGSGTLNNLRVSDAVPSDTTYQIGSLTLNATPLTDASDGDSGEFAGNAVSVQLGDVAPGSSRTVTFKVKIN